MEAWGSGGWGSGGWGSGGWGGRGWGSGGWGSGDWGSGGWGSGGWGSDRGRGDGAVAAAKGCVAGSTSSSGAGAVAAPKGAVAAPKGDGDRSSSGVAIWLPPGLPRPSPPAVAEGPGDGGFSVEYFLTFRKFSGIYRQHNQALKYWRRQSELPGAFVLKSGFKKFDNVVPEDVAVVVHGERTNFDFDPTKIVKWAWWEMIGQLRDDDIRYVVGGSSGDCQLRECSLQVRPNSYDVARHYHIERQERRCADVQLPVWDFVVSRSDGTALRLHPSWSDRRVKVFLVIGHEVLVIPIGGLGKSEGSGTFKRYLQQDMVKEVRFDSAKDLKRPV